jgi:hypothetical protein
MVFRATRGKALSYFRDIEEEKLKDYTGQKNLSTKTVYFLVFQEGQ